MGGRNQVNLNLTVQGYKELSLHGNIRSTRDVGGALNGISFGSICTYNAQHEFSHHEIRI